MSVSSASKAVTLKVCYDQWPPMTIFPTESAPERGFIIEMLEHIYSEKGYTLEYYEVPLARGLDMVAEGLCDMLPEFLYSKHSDKGFVYADEPTFAYNSAFVVRQGDAWRYDGISSLKNRRVATGSGWDYSSMSESYQNYIDNPKNARLVEVIAGNDDVIGRIFHMIKTNRVDLYADNELVLQYVLNQLDLQDSLQIVRPGLEKKLVEMPIYSMQIPVDERQRLIGIWNQGRLAMKGEKEQAFIKKYRVLFEND
ncbi:substrate-binding periplasmic protein [Marinomonas atlantica]|uniref:substrate-binding periplasmic protein n=1 Tax=Marinomonas atlantica TaxID=1806668 RepID=UPI00082A7802|nr:transporter substrate-binding domain-containing protein [Marinomonas atlantica]